MSVIASLPATPNRLLLLFRCLAGRGEKGIALPELKAFFAPGSPFEVDTIFDSVYIEAVRLGMTDTDKAKKGKKRETIVILSKELRETVGARGQSDNIFREWIESILLHPGKAEEHGQSEFPRALSWFLCQDPWIGIAEGDSVKALIARQVGAESSDSFEAYGLGNIASVSQFFYWASYLGYATPFVRHDNKVSMLPDPSKAITLKTDHLLGGKKEMLAKDFIKELGILLPVMEYGTARKEIEDAFVSEVRRKPDHLSRSTSFALLRLQEEGLLRRILKSDAQSAVILDVKGTTEKVTHVARKGP